MALDIRRACGAALLLGLAACDLTYPWTSTHVEELWASVDTTPISVAAPADAIVVPGARLVVTSNASKFWVWVSGDLLFPQMVGPFSGTGDVRISFPPPSAMPQGVYRGTLVVGVSTEPGPYGDVQIAPSPFSIPFTYEIAPPNFGAVDPDPVALAAYVGEPYRSATLSVEGPARAGPWTAIVEGDASAWLTVAPAAGDTLPAALTLTAQPLPVGSSGGTIVLRRGPSERRVRVSLSVRDPPPTWTGGTVSFAAISFSPVVPTPLDVQLDTVTGAPCPITDVWVQVSPPSVPWLAAAAPSSTAPGPLTLAVTRTDLPPGRYEASVQVTCSWDTQTAAVVPVALDVSAGDLSYPLDSLFYSVTRDTTPEQATRLVTLSASRPGVSFEIRVEGGWLTVSPSSGTIDADAILAIRVRPAGLETGYMGSREGAVVVRHWQQDGTAIERRIPANLWFQVTEVLRAAPRTIATTAPGSIAVGVSDGGYWTDDVLMFGAFPSPQTYRYPGTGVVTAAVPAVAAGSYPVWIRNGLGIVRTSAALMVASPAVRSPAAFGSPGPLTRLVFDDARGALWAVSTTPGRLERWVEGAGGWSSAGLDVPGLHDAILRDDGSVLEALAGGTALLVDPVTLAPTVPYVGAPLAPPGAEAWRWALVPTIWREAFAVTAEVAGCQTPGTCWLHVLRLDDAYLWNWYVGLYSATGASSGDLTHAVFARHGLASPEPLMAWNPARGLYGPQEPSTDATAVAVDRTGSRVLLVHEAADAGATETVLLDGAFAPLPGALPGTTAAAILSQDGSRAFTFDGAARTVRAFDLAAAPVDGRFVELGTGIATAADPGAGVVLALAADERTVFVGGDASVVVVPLP